MTGPILVTGGTGFVGSALVRRLAREGGEVHVLARASSDRSHLADPSLRWHEGDLLDPPSIDRAVGELATRARELGAPARVVHSAALISYRTDEAELSRRINTEGTRVVLDACCLHGVARVCHVSSVVAVGYTRSVDETLDEDARFRGSELRCPYTTTKRAAEDFALAVSRQLDVVAVNPGAIFGPAPGLPNTNRFLQLLAAGKFGRFAPPGSLGVVGVDDVAEGIRLALERGRRGRRYLLVESCPTHLELQRLAAEALGVPPPRAVVPPLLWKAVVAGAALVGRFRPPELVTPTALRHLGLHYRFDASRARSELGWNPEPFDRVLRSTVEWMRSAELIPAPDETES